MLGRLLSVIGALALCVAGVAASAGWSGEAGRASERLPDLDQEAPRNLVVTRGGADGGYRLGFTSAVRNVGAGPLIVSGRRPRVAIPTMTADQLIERADAPYAVVEGVGRLRYVRSPDHEHWHLLDFERYELRRATGRAGLVTDRKTGFCLGDRYRVKGEGLPAQPPEPVYTHRCGLGSTARLSLVEGISIGYGDDYKPNLEGQSLRLAGLEAGRYLLVHRVNVGRPLRESSYANNASSLLLRLRWRSGRPAVQRLRSCPHTAHCSLREPPKRLASPGRDRGAVGE
jgi:Lysyl oxidase